MAELHDALLKLSLKNGDIVLVDQACVDVEHIARCMSPSPEQENVWFVAVHVRPSLALKDVVRTVPLEDLKQVIAEIEAERVG